MARAEGQLGEFFRNNAKSLSDDLKSFSKVLNHDETTLIFVVLLFRRGSIPFRWFKNDFAVRLFFCTEFAILLTGELRLAGFFA